MKTMDLKPRGRNQMISAPGTVKISISMPPILLQKAQAEAYLGGYATLSGYIQHLLRKDSAPQLAGK